MQQEHKSRRTERPTPRRLKKAREDGQVARSKEVSGAAVLAAFLAFSHFLGRGWIERLENLMALMLTRAGSVELNVTSVLAVLNSTAVATGMLLAIPLGAVTFASVAGNLIQGPPTFTLKPLSPKFDKLNPMKGLKKIVSIRNWVEVLKSLLKMGLYGAVAYSAARGVLLAHPLGTAGAEGTFSLLLKLSGTVLLHVTGLAAGMALLDFLFRKYDHVRGLRMSKREIRDEMKQTEGDPLIRARIRQKQATLARTRMMADVQKATIVITNPEHVAVALRYVPGEMQAPKLLAKGRALIAERIRAIAREHNIPIHREPSLARAIYRSVPVGAEIPPSFFRAVAEVLALVMSGGRKKRRPRVEEPLP